MTECKTCKYCNNRGCAPWCMYDEFHGTLEMGDHIWIGLSIFNSGTRLPNCPVSPFLPSDEAWEKSANHQDDFGRLTPDEKHELCDWISENFIHRKTPNRLYTSYGLKHIFERSKHGFYITNGQFKGAMAWCGYSPVKHDALNWVFGISEKSPAIKGFRTGNRLV